MSLAPIFMTEPQKKATFQVTFFISGVGNGTRTHNARNHNPVLCQLNYTHHIYFAESGTPEGTRLINEPLGQALAGNAHPRCILSFEPMHASQKVARQKGLEPLTYCLEGSCSIQLSYWRISMERVTGIGPAYPAWKAGVLPLNYTRNSCREAIQLEDSNISSRVCQVFSFEHR